MVARSRRGRPADADTPGPGGRSPAATGSARSPVPPAGCSRPSSTADVAAPRNSCEVPATRLPAAAALRIPRTANRRTRRIDRTHPNPSLLEKSRVQYCIVLSFAWSRCHRSETEPTGSVRTIRRCVMGWIWVVGIGGALLLAAVAAAPKRSRRGSAGGSGGGDGYGWGAYSGNDAGSSHGDCGGGWGWGGDGGGGWGGGDGGGGGGGGD